MYRTALFLLAGLVLAALPAPAPAQDSAAPPAVGNEEELTQGVRSGRLGRDELIAKGRELSYFEKLRLYYYAQELEPYFRGVEEAIRDLARTAPTDRAALDQGRQALYQAMARSWQRLQDAKRPGPAVEWKRGLTGLVYLDYDWRDRVAEQGKDEIKNPYDLVALLDCLDAHLRGLEAGSIDACPVAAGQGTSGKGESKQP